MSLTVVATCAIQKQTYNMSMNNEPNSKHELVGHQFLIGGKAFQLSGWHSPSFLRAGDLLHVDESSLSEVFSIKPHRGGTALIGLTDGREICVCGGTDLAVFAATPDGAS